MMHSENTTNVRREKNFTETNVTQADTCDHLQRRVDELVRENEELRQKTQVVVKKVETNIVEKTPGMDEETSRRIADLEKRLFEAESFSQCRVREITERDETISVLRRKTEEFEQFRCVNPRDHEDLKNLFARFTALEAELVDLRNRYAILCEREKEWQLNSNLIAERDAEILSLKDAFAKIQHSQSALLRERDNLVIENATVVKRLTELETSYSAITTKYNKLEKIYTQIKGAAVNLEEVQHQLEDTAVETEKISRMKETEVVQQKSHFREEVEDKRL